MEEKTIAAGAPVAPAAPDAGNQGGGTAAPSQEPGVAAPNPQPGLDKPTSFTQEQVNEMMRARLDRDHNSMFNRYGVKNRDEFDALIAKAQGVDGMKKQIDDLSLENSSLKEKMAFMTNNVNPAKETEIKALFKGLNLPFNDENLKQMLATHPEWLNVVASAPAPTTAISALGAEHTGGKVVPESEEEKQKRVFGY